MTKLWYLLRDQLHLPQFVRSDLQMSQMNPGLWAQPCNRTTIATDKDLASESQ